MIENALEIFLFILCIVFSAFFSSSEVALISITRAKARTLANEGKPGSAAVAALKESPEHLLITILIGNTVVNIAAASIATAIAIQMFGDLGVGIATGFVVIMLLVFGEIGPKIYAARATDGFALTIAPVILFLSKLFTPVIWLVERVSPTLGIGKDTAEPAVTEDEIKEWIDVGKEDGTIEQGEQDMLYSVLEFGDTTAREIMTPRVNVILIEDAISFEEAIRIFNETGFSRIPVYHDQIDNITGILNVKDVFSAMVSRRKDSTIREIMYDPMFVPETKKIDDLLKELQVHRVQMAIVIDEYSSFVGIVTVEDILEELVGERTSELEALNERLLVEINERQSAEKELRRLNEELEAYARTVSHELRTPLTGISLALEYLERLSNEVSNDSFNKEAKAIVLKAQSTVKNADDQVKRLLELAEAGQVPAVVSNVEVSSVVEGILRDIEEEMSRRRVGAQVDGDLGTTRANPTQIQQVFSNLIINAVRHCDSEKPHIEISLLEEGPGEGRKYLVRDNGSGIPPELIDSLFSPFVKGEGGGSGTGLAIAEKIIKIYGGSIRAYNDHGACFEFVLYDYQR